MLRNLIASTFIPSGVFAFNPVIEDEEESSSLDDDADNSNVLIG